MKVNFRRLWQCVLTVAMLMFVIGMAIDTTDVKCYASQMEHLMAKGDYQGALEVGSASDKTDQHLMLLRIDALAHEHQLGDRLFSYPIAGSAKAIAAKGGDYALCASLIDKDLDRFVQLLPKYYQVNDKLPRYYREALIQYSHLRSHPAIVYHDNVMDTDYQDMQELERQYPSRRARQMAVFQQYEDTYWYYYEYLAKPKR